jgi:hypothetical protein
MAPSDPKTNRELTFADVAPENEYGLDQDALAAATKEEPFVDAAFELLKDVVHDVTILGNAGRLAADGTRVPFSRDEAILGGLVVRTMKLLHGFLHGAANQGEEIANYFLRGLAETSLNIRFLIRADSPEMFQAFVADSFRHDKRLLEVIEKNVQDRRGVVLPIEQRMRDSVDRTLRRSGLTLAEIPSNQTNTWPSFEARLAALDMGAAYAGVFGGPSSYVHGTWHELLFYNLTEVEGGFELDPSWGSLRPEFVLALVLLIAEAIVDYIDYLFAEYVEAQYLRERLIRAKEKAERVTELHEEFLARTR